MKHRPQNDRRHSGQSFGGLHKSGTLNSQAGRGSEKQKEFVTMHTGISHHHMSPLNGVVGESMDSHPALFVGTPESVPRPSKDEVQIQVEASEGQDNRSGADTQRSNSSHSHGHSRSHPRSEGPAGERSELDDRESSSSVSELRYIFLWLQKSLPYILIICAKLVFQHALGIAVGVGLCITFLYANKIIINQVFLQERRSILHCSWLLAFLTASTFLLYDTFRSQSLFYSLIFLHSNVDPVEFWDVLWIVGTADFILKFLYMGFKCLILVVPSPLMSFKSRGQWYMVIEEVSQFHRSLVPLPVWSWYLVGNKESDGFTIWTLGILLSLFYLILKLLGIYGRWNNFKRALKSLIHKQHYGIAASKLQCSEASDICPICQTEFREPILLLCQHIFCEECISLWFNREKTCPLCRTVILDYIQAWRDGATSTHLQIY
ncbi:E3 ubiquitin-protein ligase RNFT1 [Stegostoma tigrinum]|uniref:E3 ubiquitin-protein ligase RNFT1 n=1 Tax=Stegostoma tigrinum TaxID=3053191 RepID=UPI00286FEDDC|nr:E3 ubiquitin-protein ligase RNFT1 [Stegostoma tigrinum]